MGYARGTTNYNLPLTQGSDKRDWSDTNTAFADLDEAVKTANDTASSASSAASTAQTRADSAYTLASTANTAASNAATAAATADEKAVTAKSRADSAYTLADSANKAVSYTDRVSVSVQSTTTYRSALLSLHNAIDYSKVTERTKLVVNLGGLVKHFVLTQVYQNTLQFCCANIPAAATVWIHALQVGASPIYNLATIGSSGGASDVTNDTVGSSGTFTLLY